MTHNRTRRPWNRFGHAARRAGFTLIELLVAMAIVALILTALVATLQGTLKAHDDIAIEMAAVRDGPRILDMFERDVRSMHLFNIKDGNVLLGKSDHPGGLRGDRIDFVCQEDSSRRLADPSVKNDVGAGVASHVNEVGYRLRPSSFSTDFLELWRREDIFVDDQPFDGGTYEKIHDRVAAFQITYLSELGDKAEESDDWDMTQKKQLPAAIRLHIELQASPELVGGFIENKAEERKIYAYDRLIAFRDSDQLGLNVRPYLPTKITTRSGAGAGGGAGGVLGGDMTGGAGAGGAAGAAGGGAGGLPGGGGKIGSGAGAPMLDGPTMPKNPLGGDRFSNNPFDPKGGGNTKFSVGSGGNLSGADQQKIEDFLNSYRNQFGQNSLLGSGFGNSGGGGGGGRH
jgi:type II secretion system protein J